ncbi:MAG TPA: hypothetical protein QGF58_19230 [Myxococcota bacterium]|nr:hypothetical protein [Myxococcota bacterium]
MSLLIILGCQEPRYVDPPGRDSEPVESEPVVDDSPSDSERLHPEGFEDPAVHGVEAKQQSQVCVDCHGSTLEGEGAAVTCDNCHRPGWRTDCTFCHGGSDNSTGAPPLHISGVDDGESATFAPHSAHVEDTELHAAFDCTACHDKPDDPLSEGHLFVGDSTPGRAEVEFSGGIAAGSEWDGEGLCSNLYCHGDGADRRGEKGHIGSLEACGESCHWTSENQGQSVLGGEHDRHLGESGIGCVDCHNDTVDSDEGISDTSLHVNGSLDVALVSSLEWSGSTCTGGCHGKNHQGKAWSD